MSRWRRVGILGGMGPQATLLLMQKLLDAVPAADDSDHLPLIVHQNTQVPSRLGFLLAGVGPDPAPVLACMAQDLARAGAELLAMPCNTAHAFAPAIRAATPLPFLDMVALSASAALDRAGTGARIGLLASPALRRIGLLDRALQDQGLQPLWPQDDSTLLGAIRRIKAGGADPQARAALREASTRLQDQGAALQLVACSELSLVADVLAPQTDWIDTLDVLVRAVLSHASGGGNAGIKTRFQIDSTAEK